MSHHEPSSPWLPPGRKYGSLEPVADGDVIRLHHVFQKPCERVGPSLYHMHHGGEGREEAGGKRWFRVTAVASALVLGVMLGWARGGYRLPLSPTNVEGTGNYRASATSRGSLTQANTIFTSIGSSSDDAERKSADRSVQASSRRDSVEGSSLAPLSFTALNFYHARDGKPALDYPWLKTVKLIEPYRETILAVSTPRDGFQYRWEIRREDDSASPVHTSADGAETVVMLEAEHLEKNFVTLEEVDVGSGSVTRRLVEKVMVKYVRREIRTLTDEEREELLDAMFELWRVRVDGGDGRVMYGEHYSDIWSINRLHFKASSPQFCDHFHDGLGFLTSHSLLSNTFEHSLQQVNPKLTLPYWDFTIESSSAGADAADAEGLEDVFGGAAIKSPLLQESWFGTADPTTNMVKDGRWASTPVPSVRENNPGHVEADMYSKLRSPWVMNDRPFLTRGMGQVCNAHAEELYPWPTCEMHYNLVTSFSSFYSWVWESMYDPHGTVHIWIGGVLDCEETYASEIEELVGKETARDLALLAFVHRKDMFRAKIFSCNGSASATESPDEVPEAGVCGCHGYDLTQGDDYLKIFEKLVGVADLMAGTDEDTKRKMVATLCSSRVTDGDHLQSSSSLDPSFWPSHPAVERLWMYTMLTGRMTDLSWPDSGATLVASDGKTYQESISKYSDECIGHRGSDVFPFDLLSGDVKDFTVQTGIRGNPKGGGNILTNREVLEAMDPRINGLSYVYDTFDWKHCEADGFDMRDALVSLGDTERAPAAGAGTAAAPPRHETPSSSHRQSINGRTVFEKGALRFPMYSALEGKIAELQARNRSREMAQKRPFR